MRFARLPHRCKPFVHRREGQGVDVELGDLRAEQRFGRPYNGSEGHAGAAGTKAHASYHLALVAEQVFRNVPALVYLADDLFLRDLHVVEEGLTEGRGPADQEDRPRRHSWRLHVEEKEADPALLRLGRGADETEDPVRLVGIARPDLL